MKKQGKIKHTGFSFHSTPEELNVLNVGNARKFALNILVLEVS